MTAKGKADAGWQRACVKALAVRFDVLAAAELKTLDAASVLMLKL
jgi:hypothetical protein